MPHEENLPKRGAKAKESRAEKKEFEKLDLDDTFRAPGSLQTLRHTSPPRLFNFMSQ